MRPVGRSSPGYRYPSRPAASNGLVPRVAEVVQKMAPRSRARGFPIRPAELKSVKLKPPVITKGVASAILVWN